MKPRSVAMAVLMLQATRSLGIAAPGGTAFTYQGRLGDKGNPATGLYELQAVLYDSASNGLALATNQVTSLLVSNGLFFAALDFGSAVFNGDARWLELSVRTNGAAIWTLLAPRQSVTPTPYSLRAASAGTVTGPIADSQLSTNIPRLGSSNYFSGTINAAALLGDGSRLTGVARINPSPSQGPPFSVSTNTLLVTNLNADLLDGQNAGVFALTNHTHSGADIVSGTLPGGRLAGVYSNAVSFTNSANVFGGIFAGAVSGSGAGLTNLNVALVGPAGGDLSGSYPNPTLTNNAVTAAKVATGQVVKSLNSLHDVVTLAAGTNIFLTTNGNTLQFAATNATLASLGIKSGTVSGMSGADSTFRTNITFTTAYPSTNYAISVTAEVFHAGPTTAWIQSGYTNRQPGGFSLLLFGAANSTLSASWMTVPNNN